MSVGYCSPDEAAGPNDAALVAMGERFLARAERAEAERDRLRGLLAGGLDAIEVIGRHRRGNDPCTYGWCLLCGGRWPCPTEQAHIAAEEIREALGEGT